MIRVLHIDDNRDHLELVKHKLSRLTEDLDLEWAESAEEAFECLERSSYECILSDYQMPGTNGLAILQRLRESGVRIPFIFLTGQGNEEVAAQALRSGADDYYTKQQTFAHYERLVHSIRRVVEASKQKSEKEEAEEALRQSEEKYRALFETSNDAIYFTSREGRVIDANPASEKLIGYTKDEMKNLNTADTFVNQGEREKYRPEIEERGYVKDFPVALRRKDGKIIHVLITSSVQRDENGEVLGYRGIMRDVTDQVKAEKLRYSIYDIVDATNLARNIHELFHSIHNIVSELIPAENFYIALYDSEKEELTFPYFVDQFDAPPSPKKPGKGLTEYILRKEKPLLASPEVLKQLIEKGEVAPAGSRCVDWLGVPLKTKGKTIGVLTVQTYSDKVRLGEEAKNILTMVSSQAAMAIERKRAEEAFIENEKSYCKQLEALRNELNTIRQDLELVSTAMSRELLSNMRLINGYLELVIEGNQSAHSEETQANLRKAQKLSSRTLERLGDLLSRCRGIKSDGA